MTLGPPIALGRTAEIYPWHDGRVLKLYFPWFSRADVGFEARVARAVYDAGLPAPAVGQIMEVDGRPGLEYERIEGMSTAEHLAVKPWLLPAMAKLLADLQATIHAVRGVKGIPDQRQKLERSIQAASALPEDLRVAALTSLRKLSQEDCLCHGDFHPANVLLTAKGPVLIDWIDASVGNPLYDVARTTILAQGEIATGQATGPIARLFLHWLHQTYTKRYFQQRPRGRAEYRAWQPIVGAARMSEGIVELQDWLREQVRRGLSG